MSEKRFTIVGKEWISYYGGDAQIVSDGNFTFRVWEREEDAQKVCDLLNEQQATITELKEENEKLRQMIKENVFQRYREGSLEDLAFKAIAYDDIIKVKLSEESEPKVRVYCNYGKRENIRSFCQMFIPFGIDYEIKEVIGDE